MTPFLLNVLKRWEGEQFTGVWLNWDEKAYKDGRCPHWCESPILFAVGRTFFAMDCSNGVFSLIQDDKQQGIGRWSAHFATAPTFWCASPFGELHAVVGERIDRVHVVGSQGVVSGIELVTVLGAVTFCLNPSYHPHDGRLHGLDFERQIADDTLQVLTLREL